MVTSAWDVMAVDTGDRWVISQRTKAHQNLYIRRDFSAYNRAMQSLTCAGKSLSFCTSVVRYLAKSFLPHADIPELKKAWAQEALNLANVKLEVVGDVTLAPSTLFVGNHISYLDIPLMMKCIHGVSFVAKKEIESWPLIGFGARRIDTVFVKRENRERRNEARQSIADALGNGKRIVLFPSGTTSLNEATDWRRGPFEIAQKHAQQIQPFRISYTPARLAAFIDDDLFLPHLARVFSSGTIHCRVEFHQPVQVHEAEESRRTWQDWCRGMDASTAAKARQKSNSRPELVTSPL